MDDPVQITQRITQLGRQGHTQDALTLYKSIQQPTIRQLNAVLDACARARPVQLDTALDLFSSTTLNKNVYSYGMIMNAVARAANVTLALQLLDELERPNNSIEANEVVYQSAISAAANAVEPQIALQLLQRAQQKGIPLTVVGYNAVITAASKASDWELAVRLLQDMEKLSELPAPDSITYGTVMAACEKCREWERVLEYAYFMESHDIPLDGMAYTSALHACQQLSLGNAALEFLENMKHMTVSQRRATLGRHRAGSRQALRGPDAVAYKLAISACARGRQWQDGIRVLKEYETSDCFDETDCMAYTAAITGCEYAGEYETSLKLLSRMRKRNIPVNEVTLAAVIGSCATACANLETAEEKRNAAPHLKALQLLHAVRKDSSVVSPNLQMYNQAMRACAEALDETTAFSILEMMEQDGLEPSIVTYGTLMTACERTNSMKGLEKVFLAMRERNVPPNEIVYGAALSCCRKAGEAERAYLLLQKMIKDGLEPNVVSFNTVLRAQLEVKHLSSKDFDRAFLVFKMLNSKTYEAASPSRQTYSMLVRALTNHDRPQEAEVFLKLMRQSDIAPDVDLYTATVSSYERNSQPLKALQLMESMREDGYDFYESSVLNAAFKRLVKLANVVGQTWKSEDAGVDPLPILHNETGTSPIL